MYEITLTSEERRAIDWIGNRYFHGDPLFGFLWDIKVITTEIETDWSDKDPITFKIPHEIAHMICDELEFPLTHFADELNEKFKAFCKEVSNG